MTLKQEFENIIIPNGYKTIHVGRQYEVLPDQFVCKETIERLWQWIEEKLKEARRKEMWDDLKCDSEIYEHAIDDAIKEAKETRKVSKHNETINCSSIQTTLYNQGVEVACDNLIFALEQLKEKK